MEEKRIDTIRRAIDAFNRREFDAFDDYEVEIGEIEQNGDRFFISCKQRGRGVGSGLEFELPFYWAVTMGPEKMERLQISTDPETARSAAGLED
jgi:hypothetical protein